MTATIHDDQGIFSSSDIAAIQSEAGRWPFELRVFSRTEANKTAMAADVHGCISAPNIVCIGIDAQHRYTETHFGTATGVRASDFNLIAAAGNASFKASNWRGGVESIADRALESTRTNVGASVVVVQSTPAPVAVQSQSHMGWWILGFALLAATIAAGWWFLRRRQKAFEDQFKDAVDDIKSEASELRARNMEEGEWHERFRETAARPRASKPLSAPRVSYVPAPAAPSQVIVNQTSGSSDALTGAIVGYEVGRIESESRSRHGRSYDDDRSYSSDSSSDTGGGSSSWDWGSSSSSDSGGGGFDFGGGGSDFGGGGSDF